METTVTYGNAQSLLFLQPSTHKEAPSLRMLIPSQTPFLPVVPHIPSACASGPKNSPLHHHKTLLQMVFTHSSARPENSYPLVAYSGGILPTAFAYIHFCLLRRHRELLKSKLYIEGNTLA